MSASPAADAAADRVALLRAEGVRKHYGSHEVLRGIDLDVAAGEVVCVIGGSGSGKSTLLRCLNLLEPVTDGTVWFDGRDVTDPRVDADEVRRDIGMVFQSYNLFPHQSVLGNVTLAPRLLGRMSRREARTWALEQLHRFGLGEKADAHPDALSGGQQQRVALVQAMAMKPRVLLLDEVTSALDPELVGEVLEAVRDLASSGLTVVMATHEMSFARDVADRVAFLHDGLVHEQGAAARVLADPQRERTRAFLARHLRG